MNGVLERICAEYGDALRFDGGVFSDDPERVARLKWVVCNRLTDAERTVLFLYLHFGSCRKLAARLGVSPQTACRRVRRVREKVAREYTRIETIADVRFL